LAGSEDAEEDFPGGMQDFEDGGDVEYSDEEGSGVPDEE
jgi:hypothetical protein